MTGTGTDLILVGVDGSAESLAAARWAVAEGAVRGWPVRLVYVYSWPVPPVPLAPTPYNWSEETLRRDAGLVVDQAVREVRPVAAQVPVTGEAVLGSAANVLISRSAQASLVVVGHRGHGGFATLLLGSVAANVAAHAGSPVAVIRPGTDDRPARAGTVLVGTDGSPAADAAVGFAFEEADRRGATVLVLHAWEPPAPPWRGDPSRPTFDVGELGAAEEHRLDELTQRWQDKYPRVVARRSLVAAAPATALIDAARQADLMVVGSRGRGGFAGLLLGSVSQQVIHHAPCPVVVVR